MIGCWSPRQLLDPLADVVTERVGRNGIVGAPALKVLQSGPLLSDDQKEIGSLIVLEAENAGAVEAFLGRDPYVQSGLFAERRVHPWLWRRGNPYLSSSQGL
jgi:hypothetical protein